MEIVFESENIEQTEKLGVLVGKLLVKGDFLALTGDLGAGKTAFTKGVAKGLGIDEEVTSPTFTIINEYHGGSVSLAHMDVYRLKNPEELENIGFYDYLQDFVIVMEWADKVKEILPEDVLWVDFKVSGESKRKIKFASKSAHYDSVIEELKNCSGVGNK